MASSMGTPGFTRNSSRPWEPHWEKVMTPRVLFEGGLVIGHLRRMRGCWRLEAEVLDSKRSCATPTLEESANNLIDGGAYAPIVPQVSRPGRWICSDNSRVA